MKKNKLNILLVEDNLADVLFLREALAQDALADFQLTVVKSLTAALEALPRQTFQAALLDLGLPDRQGLETFLAFHRAAPELPVVVLSALDDEEMAMQAMQAGAQDYLVKRPQDYPSTGRALRYAIERQRNQAELRASEERYRFIIDNTSDFIARYSRNGMMVFASGASSRFNGYLPEEIVNTPAFERIHPDDHEKVRRTLKQLIEDGIESKLEMRIRCKTGEYIWAEIIGRRVFTPEGEPEVIATQRNITERKQAEEKLRQSEERYRALFNDSPISLWEEDFSAVKARLDDLKKSGVTDFYQYFADHPQEVIEFAGLVRVVDVNNASLDLLGVPQKGDLLNSLENNLKDEAIQGFEIELIKIAEGQTKFGWEGRNQRLDGKLIDVHLSWSVAPGYEHDLSKVFVSITDISQLKQAEQKLRASENKYHQLFEAAPIGILLANIHGEILDVNPAVVQILGSPSAEATKAINMLTFPPLIQAGISADFQKTIALQQTQTHEYPYITKWGKSIYIYARFTPLFDTHGKLERVQILFEDITERKRAEAELRASEEKYRGLLESLDSVLVVLDEEGRHLYINEVGANLFNATPAEILGKSLAQVFPPETAEQEHKTIRQVFQADHPIVRESQIFAQGTPRWYHIVYQPIHDEHGQVIQVLVNATDIHTLKITQEELAELNRTLEKRVKRATAEIQDLYDNAPAGYHSLDANGCFSQINQTELNWLGYTREELLGHPFANFVTPAGLDTFRQNFPAFKQRGWLRELEMEFRRKDGTTFLALVNAVAIKDENGHYLTSRSTVFDITERKQAEQNLRESRDRLDRVNRELERASRAKDEFLANMSHELRTPLNGILGMAEILLTGHRGPLNERQQTFVNTIDASGRHLLSLINDILDLSKIEADKLDLHLETVSVVDICQASLAFVKQPAINKGIKLGISIDGTLTTLQADARRVKQILVNLLNNAVKFTPAGGQVTLAARLNGDTQSVEFSISDTGIGIAAEDQARLFVPFTQVDNTLTRQYEGTGLGLALVKRLTELHGGRVFLESVPGQGSRFTVSLPWAAEPAPPPPRETDAAHLSTPTPQDQKNKATILLAEDNPANILALADYLDAKGYSLVIAKDGYEVLNKAAESAPDLILMDIQMPNMDGLEATRRLRADPQFATTPILALTAFAMSGDRERCLAAGATAYLSKPVQLKELAAMIETLLAAYAYPPSIAF